MSTGSASIVEFPRRPDAARAAPKRPRTSKPAATSARRILAVGGGKGGIGKSLISANLGIELARRGLKVAVLDFDLGGANLHTCLGVDQPRLTLSDFVMRRVETLGEVLTDTGVPNLSLVSGALDALDMANPLYQQKLRLLRAVQGLDVDVALLDLGAGTGFNVLDFFLLADHGVLTLVPEPTSVENAYRFLKAAFFRRLRAVETVYGLTEVLDEVMRGPASRTAAPAQILEKVQRRDPAAGEALAREMAAFRPLVVVNQVREDADLLVGEGICSAWRRFFGLDMGYLGAVRHDEGAWRAVRDRRPLLLARPDAPAAQDFARLADSLLALPAREGV
jgi:flagellar biosynthesis protein FlhG